MDTEDFSFGADGVRKPDPTLGKYLNRRSEPLPGELEIPEVPEIPERIRRQRVVLADPRMAANSLRALVELEEQTSWGEWLIKDLVKIQLHTGLALALMVVAPLGALPVTFYCVPSLARLSVIGVPLPWLVLGVLPFPLLFGVGLWYNRLAERHERNFVETIEK